jgi:mono/diheme cytochrome c family protein
MNLDRSNFWKVSLSAMICAYLLAASAAPVADAPTPGDAQKGKQVFERVGCSRCHGSAGEGMSSSGKEGGPPKIAGTHLAFGDFVDSVRHPKGAMPPFGSKQVSEQDLADVYAYLHSADLGAKVSIPTSANAKKGQQLYTSFGCYQCHGYEGQGSGQTGGARIGPPQIPYSGFVAYVRQPSGQMPPYTAKAASDAQLADIYVFLQSRPLPPPSKAIPLLNQ